MREFRYICTLCGPILPEHALSDDGTQVERRRGVCLDGGLVDIEVGEEEPLLSDPLGAIIPSQVALPLSPDVSPHSPFSPTLTLQQIFPFASHPFLPVIPAHISHKASEDERGGYELCSECVETAGVRHANDMGDVREGGVELRYAFAEVMKMSRRGLQGWREVGE